MLRFALFRKAKRIKAEILLVMETDYLLLKSQQNKKEFKRRRITTQQSVSPVSKIRHLKSLFIYLFFFYHEYSQNTSTSLDF